MRGSTETLFFVITKRVIKKTSKPLLRKVKLQVNFKL